MNLYINRNLDASSSSVTSVTENINKNLPSLFLGDVQEINVALIDGNGSYDPQNSTAKLSIAVGNLASGQIYAQTSTLVYDPTTFAHKGSLNLSTSPLATALDGLSQDTFTFEIQMDFGNYTITIYQTSVVIFNQLITSNNEDVDGSELNTDLLFAHYKCNQLTTDGNVKDSSGNGRDLTLYGPTITEGRFGNALHFDGVVDYANAFSNFNTLGNAYTIAFYVMLLNENSNKTLPIFTLGKDFNDDSKKYVEVSQVGKQIRIKSTYTSTNKFTTNYTAEGNTWYHIAVVKTSDTTQEVYINGSLFFYDYKSNWGSRMVNVLN